jgi:Lanthionine synthetase C-like protein
METSRALELAVEAANFIEAQRAGDVWRQTPAPTARIDHSLYAGSAGIIVFFLELAEATGNRTYDERAVAAGSVLAEYVSQQAWASVSFSSGWTGYAFALDQLHMRTNKPEFGQAAKHCRAQLLSQSQRFGSGIGWVEPAPFADITKFSDDREVYDLSVGAAGSGLAYLDSGSESDVAVAIQIGDRLVEVAERRDDGWRWGLMSDMPFAFTAPNFAHGGNGVAYFMARLFAATGEQRFLHAALEGARSFVASMQTVGAGCLVCHTEEQEPSEFYLGLCHGPAGSARLFALLGRLTEDTKWADHLNSLFLGVAALGAPETRSWGWWNNYSRCCGDAGLGDAALLFQNTPGVNGVDMQLLADRCGAVLEEVSQAEDGKRWWEQAEHRTRPTFTQAQTGFRQGAAGIGSFFVHLATSDSPEPVRVLWPDEVL